MLGFTIHIIEGLIRYYLEISIPEATLAQKTQNLEWFELLLFGISLCIIVPFQEELIFRGLLFNRLTHSGLKPILSITMTSTLFALMHLDFNTASFVYLLMFSVIVTYVRYKTKNLYYCVALHIQNNSLAFIAMII
ncbi:CPBP family intramembrane glutamic endopeptidase [Agaribacter flavus]|uniref:CPBP family intramembrane glutamic endopeptidase n=1 Tax=Agaribacter flavus TaxID=1902781 RepID=A0ABV7FS19_9ALTE